MSAKHLVVVLVELTPLSTLETLKEKLGPSYEVKYAPNKGEELTADELARMEVLMMYVFPKTMTSIEQVPKLKLVQLASAGWNHLESSPFYQSIPKEHPLIMSSASGIHVTPIAEHVVMTAMAINHRLANYVTAQTKAEWLKESTENVKELRGSTMGVLGYGHIGRECARLGKAFGMNVVVATRSGKKSTLGGYLTEGTGDHEGDIPTAWYSTEDKQSIHTFYSKTDILVNTLPSAASTRSYVSTDAFNSLPSTAMLINIGRGDTVSTPALIHALLPSTPEAERIACASLDVTDPEPLPKDNVLWGLGNVLITPHVSGLSTQYWVRATDLCAVNAKRVLEQGLGGLNAVRGRGE